ncbi:unnamed protein product [Camellia sinensis]
MLVQAVALNHHVPQVLLSGTFDHTVVMKDGRIPSHTRFKWSVSADVETVAWDPHTEHSFVVSLEDGTVEGNEGREYVLRHILRRAVRYGTEVLKAQPGFFNGLVKVVVQVMGDIFPELRHHEVHIRDIIVAEETTFGKTLLNSL